MLLDYHFNKKKQLFSISYINEQGQKALLQYNVGKFKRHEIDHTGPLTNWDGRKAREILVDNPNNFDVKIFMDELSDEDKSKIFANNIPRLYTFDIEVDYTDDEFPEPSVAKFPILTIAVTDDQLNTIVLGTGEMKKEYEVGERIYEYINKSEFYRSLELEKPKFKYIRFDSEEMMLSYFLKTIVAKVPIIAGWNSLLFDWQYIQNRATYFPNLSLYASSINYSLGSTQKYDLRDQAVRLSIPKHTAVMDMMDIVGNYDLAVMPQKESLSLEYIASESPVGLGKIKYDGSLKDLYHNDFDEYVFYNTIDSILVQLIDRCFKTLNNIYTQANYAKVPIERALSKIALSDALFWNYFRNEGFAIVPVERVSERGELVGAYVKEPTPGRHNWVCCNDFSSLYPSTIITCNLSVENFLGPLDDLDKYKSDPNYFVSVMGNVYKNDKDYAFKYIQKELKANRAKGKYIAKELNARIVSDLEHMLSGHSYDESEFSDSIQSHLRGMGYGYKYIKDIDDPSEFLKVIKKEITYLVSYEQACKLLGNSMYGGSSHVASAFFNILLANDITGEARNLIKKFEAYIPEWFERNWYKRKDLHKLLGIEPVKVDGKLVNLVYGDTDSLYISYDRLIESMNLSNDSERLEALILLNREFLDSHNKKLMDDYYRSRHVDSIHEFELETIARSGIWLNIKKRYAQAICWQDGRYFDMDALPIKAKGLEIIKASYPSKARESLKKLVDVLIKTEDPLDKMNEMNQTFISEWNECEPDQICPTSSCKNYNKYVLNDKTLELEKATPFVVRGAATYNYLRQKHHLSGNPIYGGKLRYYYCDDRSKHKRVMVFEPNNYQEWMSKYAPIDKKAMYEKCVLDPINRILEAIDMQKLQYDGSLYQYINLFD